MFGFGRFRAVQSGSERFKAERHYRHVDASVQTPRLGRLSPSFLCAGKPVYVGRILTGGQVITERLFGTDHTVS